MTDCYSLWEKATNDNPDAWDTLTTTWYPEDTEMFAKCKEEVYSKPEVISSFCTNARPFMREKGFKEACSDDKTLQNCIEAEQGKFSEMEDGKKQFY